MKRLLLLLLPLLALASCAPILSAVQGDTGTFARDGASILLTNPTGGGQIQSVMQPATPISTQMALRGELTSNSSREGVGIGKAGDPAFTLQANHGHAVQFGSAVRRLLPVECEKLMGWEPQWTKYGINAKGKQYELADGPRYRICGNGWGQPVVTWIAKRILAVDALLRK